jgi:hypothetical protein
MKMDYNEYKKLRAKGYRAMSAKSIADNLQKVFPFDIDFEGETIIKRNGLKFVVSFEEDKFIGWSLVEDNYGYWADERPDGVFAVQHEPHNSRTYNWFIPANVPSVRELSRMGMDKATAQAKHREYALQNYKRAKSYGEDWAYFDLCVKVYLDEDIIGEKLAAGYICGIEIDYGLYDDNLIRYVHVLIEEMIPSLTDEALEEIKKIRQTVCRLVIRDDYVFDPKKAYDELMEYGATILVLDDLQDLTPSRLRSWIEATYEVEEDKDCIPSACQLVQEFAEEFVDYVKSL